MSASPSLLKSRYPDVVQAPLSDRPAKGIGASRAAWQFFAASAFLVSVPVFFQAPLVRSLPWLSLLLTLIWWGISWRLNRNAKTQQWGDLLLGFTWTWLAGSIYWGWLRWEPLLHLPVESIALPITLFTLSQGKDKIGNFFYFGSLLGTAITDLYFYLVNLIPQWRQLMQVQMPVPQSTEPQAQFDAAAAIFQSAIAQIQTSWGINCAAFLIVVLLILGCFPLRSTELHWWVFGGAVLSTLLVDGLFWLATAVI